MWRGGEAVLVRVEPDVLVVELDHVELPLPPLVELEGGPPEPHVRDGGGGGRGRRRLGGEPRREGERELVGGGVFGSSGQLLDYGPEVRRVGLDEGRVGRRRIGSVALHVGVRSHD